MKKIYLAVLLVLILSCNKDDCVEFYTRSFSSINAPETGNINEDIIILVGFTVINGCYTPLKFFEKVNGNVITIEGVRVMQRFCQICTATASGSGQYIFKTGKPGEYTFKFKKSNGDFFTTVINIE